MSKASGTGDKMSKSKGKNSKRKPITALSSKSKRPTGKERTDIEKVLENSDEEGKQKEDTPITHKKTIKKRLATDIRPDDSALDEEEEEEEDEQAQDPEDSHDDSEKPDKSDDSDGSEPKKQSTRGGKTPQEMVKKRSKNKKIIKKTKEKPKKITKEESKAKRQAKAALMAADIDLIRKADELTWRSDGNLTSAPTLWRFKVTDIMQPPPEYLSRPPADPMDPQRIALKKSIWESPFTFSGLLTIAMLVPEAFDPRHMKVNEHYQIWATTMNNRRLICLEILQDKLNPHPRPQLYRYFWGTCLVVYDWKTEASKQLIREIGFLHNVTQKQIELTNAAKLRQVIRSVHTWNVAHPTGRPFKGEASINHELSVKLQLSIAKVGHLKQIGSWSDAVLVQVQRVYDNVDDYHIKLRRGEAVKVTKEMLREESFFDPREPNNLGWLTPFIYCPQKKLLEIFTRVADRELSCKNAQQENRTYKASQVLAYKVFANINKLKGYKSTSVDYQQPFALGEDTNWHERFLALSTKYPELDPTRILEDFVHSEICTRPCLKYFKTRKGADKAVDITIPQYLTVYLKDCLGKTKDVNIDKYITASKETRENKDKVLAIHRWGRKWRLVNSDCKMMMQYVTEDFKAPDLIYGDWPQFNEDATSMGPFWRATSAEEFQKIIALCNLVFVSKKTVAHFHMYGGDMDEKAIFDVLREQLHPNLFFPFTIWKYNKTAKAGFDFISATERAVLACSNRSEMYWGCGYAGTLGHQFRHNLIAVPSLHNAHFRLKSNNLYNPYQKPAALNERLLQMFVPPGGRVIDLCAGSASMAVAAIRFGYDALSFEATAQMFKLASAHILKTIENLEKEAREMAYQQKAIKTAGEWADLSDKDQCQWVNRIWEDARQNVHDPRMVPYSETIQPVTPTRTSTEEAPHPDLDISRDSLNDVDIANTPVAELKTSDWEICSICQESRDINVTVFTKCNATECTTMICDNKDTRCGIHSGHRIYCSELCKSSQEPTTQDIMKCLTQEKDDEEMRPESPLPPPSQPSPSKGNQPSNASS